MYLYSFVLYRKNSRKVLLVIYLSTFFCLSPFYLILYIFGVWQWGMQVDPPIDGLDLRVCASLGFITMTNASVVILDFFFDVLAYVNTNTGCGLKLLSGIVGSKESIVKGFRILNLVVLIVMLLVFWFGQIKVATLWVNVSNLVLKGYVIPQRNLPTKQQLHPTVINKQYG